MALSSHLNTVVAKHNDIAMGVILGMTLSPLFPEFLNMLRLEIPLHQIRSDTFLSEHESRLISALSDLLLNILRGCN